MQATLPLSLSHIPPTPHPPTISPEGVHGLDTGVGDVAVEGLEVMDGANDGVLEVQCWQVKEIHTRTHMYRPAQSYRGCRNKAEVQTDRHTNTHTYMNMHI